MDTLTEAQKQTALMLRGVGMGFAGGSLQFLGHADKNAKRGAYIGAVVGIIIFALAVPSAKIISK